MIIPWRGIVIAAVAAASFSSGVAVTHWKHNSDELHAELTRQHAENLARELMSDIARQTAAAIGGIRVENRTIYQTARTEILREPVYSECLIPAAGGVLVNEARGHGADRSGTDAALPSDPRGAGSGGRAD